MTRMRVLMLVLFVSLAINLFFGGLTIGRWVDHGRPWFASYRGSAPDGPGPFWLRRAVGEEAMPTLRAAWERHGQDVDTLREQAHETRLRVVDTLAAEPFDADAYAESLDAMHAARNEMRVGMHAFMIDLAQNLTPEQRAKLAERGRAWAERRYRRHH